jgi:hypothetical protein
LGCESDRPAAGRGTEGDRLPWSSDSKELGQGCDERRQKGRGRWSACSRKSPEAVCGRPVIALVEGTMALAVFFFVDRVASKTSNPRFDVSLWHQHGKGVTRQYLAHARLFESLVQLPNPLVDLVHIGVDNND